MANPASDANGMTVHRFVCSANGQPSVRHDRCRVSPRGKTMKIGSLFMAVMVAVALTACSSAARRGELTSFQRAFVTPQPCTTQDCPVAVTVTEDPQTGTCSGTVDIPYLDLILVQAASATITWTITDGYVFSTEPFKYAIIIKSDPLQAVQECKRADERQAPRDPIRPHYLRTFIWVWSELPAGSNGDFCDMLDPYMID